MHRHRFSKSTLNGWLIGAAVFGVVAVLPAPEAKAACLTSAGTAGNPGYNPCVTFDGNTTTVSNYQGFTGGGLGVDPDVGYARIGFVANNFNINSPFTISGVSLKGPGITGQLNFGDVTISSNGSFFYTNILALNTAQDSWLFTGNQLSFTIPGGYSLNGGTIDLSIAYCTNFDCSTGGSAQVLQNTKNGVTTATQEVPAPLPIFGAGLTFAWSRRLRSRLDFIKQSAD